MRTTGLNLIQLIQASTVLLIFLSSKTTKQRIYINISVSTRSEERHSVTEFSIRVPLTISSLYTNWVPILRIMAVAHTIFVFQISMINMQKILNEILKDMVRNYHNPHHEPDKKN